MRLSLENVLPLRSFSELSSRSSGETKLSGEISSRSSDETRSTRSSGEALPAKDAAEEAEAASEEVVGEAEEEDEEEDEEEAEAEEVEMTVVEELPSGSGGGVGPDTSVDPLYGDTA